MSINIISLPLPKDGTNVETLDEGQAFIDSDGDLGIRTQAGVLFFDSEGAANHYTDPENYRASRLVDLEIIVKEAK